MAKIPFSKLNLKPNTEISNVSWIDDKGVETVFEVKHCLPIKEKMELVSNIVNQSIDDNGFYNPMRVKIFTCLEIVYAYTNLTFTAKQKEDVFKLYDLLTHNGLYLRIIQDIKDLKEINENVE
jgi:prolyl-tRNA synthetase